MLESLLGQHWLRRMHFTGQHVAITGLIVLFAVVGLDKYSAFNNTAHIRIVTLCYVKRGRVVTSTDDTYAVAGNPVMDQSIPGQITLRSPVVLVLAGTYTITYKHYRLFGWYPEIVAATRLPFDEQHIDTCP